jgi:hypothetical protein
MRLWPEFIWIRTGSSAELLCKRQYISGFHKRRGILNKLSELGSVELVQDLKNKI